ncbi:sulfate/molybdate ABC transporter ATP-binding protein [Salinibacterium sp. M195]|uniref:sulfate/molybdate ABC transporter ATP-binding protein n=1 Tax=Salinibacterium sp. M195 TaxID=2583374 RepID=UPI001C627896|nr:ATP-binding cassette domain-containing protein [Salinibacterium sp. M195]QYH36728.1 ATP-binding cassette domain-containing protein [Salinibacterium sp. M195]
MVLQTELVVQRGPFTLDVALKVGAGETVAILGPNGSGKSTLLAAIAGLVTPDRGVVTVNGRALTRVPAHGSRKRDVSVHRRRISLLGQDSLLFPHLTVLENVAFGPRARGIGAAPARRIAGAWIAAVGLTEFAERAPASLSGGQQQRIAIARMLATEPDVLLFDEPMAALDIQNASLVRTLLRERLTDRHSTLPGHVSGRLAATIIVTHDVVDAMVLADRVAIMEEGKIVDIGGADRVLRQPASPFAAALVNLNLLNGIVETATLVRTADGRRFASLAPLPPIGSEASIVFSPSAVVVTSLRSEHGRPRVAFAGHEIPNTWRASIATLEPAVRGVRLTFRGDSVAAEASATEILEERISSGDSITAFVDPAAVTIYPRRISASSSPSEVQLG